METRNNLLGNSAVSVSLQCKHKTLHDRTGGEGVTQRGCGDISGHGPGRPSPADPAPSRGFGLGGLQRGLQHQSFSSPHFGGPTAVWRHLPRGVPIPACVQGHAVPPEPRSGRGGEDAWAPSSYRPVVSVSAILMSFFSSNRKF